MDRFARNAALLWSGQFVSQMGDSVFVIAVAWLTTRLTGSSMATGVAVFLSTAPFLVLGPFVGAWVDRADRRAVMIGSDLARAAILLGFAFGVGPAGTTTTAVYAAALLVACASTPFLPARDALLPRIAEGRPLVRVNAAFQTSGQLALIAVLAPGGLLLADGSVERVLRVLALDGATFLVSAATLAFLVVPAAPARDPAPRPSLAREALDGLAEARRDPLLRSLLLLTALDNLVLMGPAIVGATRFVDRDLGLGARELTWFEGAMAAGFFVGAVAIARFAGRVRNGPLILWGMTLDGLTYVPFFWVDSYPLALALVFVHGAFIPWIVVGRTSLLQAHVPEGRRGRVFALVHLTVAGMTALSALGAGWIGEVAGARALFLIAGVFGAACGVVGLVEMPRLRAAT